MYKFIKRHQFVIYTVFIVVGFGLSRLEKETQLNSPLGAIFMLLLAFIGGFSLFEDIKTAKIDAKLGYIYRSTNPIAYWFFLAIYAAGVMAISYVALKMLWIMLTGGDLPNP